MIKHTNVVWFQRMCSRVQITDQSANIDKRSTKEKYVEVYVHIGNIISWFRIQRSGNDMCT